MFPGLASGRVRFTTKTIGKHDEALAGSIVLERSVVWAGIVYIGYVVGVSLVVWFVTDPVDSLFSLGFSFGSRIELVAHGEPLGDALRLPFIPYFLGALAGLRDDYVFALLVKNFIF